MSQYLRLNVRDAVKVGDLTLPGVMTSLNVNGSLEVIQDKLEGSSAHLTSVEGYTTAAVTIDIVILGTDAEREKQLGDINAVFMVNPPEGQVKGAQAQAFRVVNPHLDARRIRKMLFTRFDSRDSSEDDSTTVTLEFKEILSEQARLEKAAEQDAGTDPTTAGPAELPGTAAEGQPEGGGQDAKPPEPVDPFTAGRAAGIAATEAIDPVAVAKEPPKRPPNPAELNP